MATNEFKQLDCTIRLNLDPDASSLSPPTDWQSLPLCSPGTLMVADSDAIYYAGYRTDSIRLRLLAPTPDAPLEYLTASPTGAISVSGQGTGWLTLAAASGTALATANADYQAALRTALWHNDAASPTPGLRTVEVVAYASGGRTDTSYAYLSVPVLLSAGLDTAFAVCSDAPPFVLSTPGAAMGGAWSPALPGGVFSAQSDLPGTFVYSISNGLCPADTASVAVSVFALPVFSLGADTSVCLAQLPLTMSAPGLSLWHDGSISNNYSVALPDLLWAEYTDANGCRFRDSLLLTLLPAAQGQSAVQPCYGQPYPWNGQTFSTDTTVCATFVAANGCDSIHCLTLSFFYPVRTLNTSICSGQSLMWLGAAYASTGVFVDTVMLNGCLTATSLALKVRPPDTVLQSILICNGESYAAGGQVFSTTGQYLIPLSNQMGCDTLLRLDLTVLQPAVSAVSAFVCPGMGYVFNGDTLLQAGVYAAIFQTPEGCDSTVTLSLGLLPAPVPKIVGDTVLCAGTSAMLSAGAFAAYAWSGGETVATLNVSAPGSYTVTVTGGSGCTATASTSVSELAPMLAIWDTSSPLCHGDSTGFIELASISGGVQPILFSLNGNVPKDTPQFAQLPAGDWEVLAVDSAGCTVSFLFTLTDPSALAVDLGPSPELMPGDTYAIPVQVNQSGLFNYGWSPPDGLNCTDCPDPLATASEEITYTLLLSTPDGCEASDSVTLRIRRNGEVYVPNAFSPDGDSRNETLTVYGNVGTVNAVKLFEVYDRWGELLYSSKTLILNDETSGWDGGFRGKKVLPGVYVWQAAILLNDGSLIYKNGEVTVYR